MTRVERELEISNSLEEDGCFDAASSLHNTRYLSELVRNGREAGGISMFESYAHLDFYFLGNCCVCDEPLNGELCTNCLACDRCAHWGTCFEHESFDYCVVCEPGSEL